MREFGMTAIANGITLHGGFLPYTSTFLMFVEYARNAVRMAALMKQRQVLVYPRLHRSGRRRPDTPAGGAGGFLRLTPNVSTGVRVTSGIRGGVEIRRGTCRRPDGADPPVRTGTAGAYGAAAGGYRPRCVRAEGLRRSAAADPDCHRL
ncbi:hypothetical protein CWS02_16265 [Enterobacter sp. EA-1]|nr:hypothetical protein CWS02_16265 [Enterobacter sp. EA-1]